MVLYLAASNSLKAIYALYFYVRALKMMLSELLTSALSLAKFKSFTLDHCISTNLLMTMNFIVAFLYLATLSTVSTGNHNPTELAFNLLLDRRK